MIKKDKEKQRNIVVKVSRYRYSDWGTPVPGLVPRFIKVGTVRYCT